MPHTARSAPPMDEHLNDQRHARGGQPARPTAIRPENVRFYCKFVKCLHLEMPALDLAFVQCFVPLHIALMRADRVSVGVSTTYAPCRYRSDPHLGQRNRFWYLTLPTATWDCRPYRCRLCHFTIQQASHQRSEFFIRQRLRFKQGPPPLIRCDLDQKRLDMRCYSCATTVGFSVWLPIFSPTAPTKAPKGAYTSRTITDSTATNSSMLPLSSQKIRSSSVNVAGS